METRKASSLDASALPGAALTAELMVNTITANIQRLPSVAIEGNGDFVVVWEANFQDGGGFGVFGRRFNSAGIAQGGEFRANSFTPSSQRLAAIDLDADGDFVVTWISSGQDGNAYGVFGQRFSSAGGPLGSRVPGQLDLHFRARSSPASALDSDGDFVVVWLSYDGGSHGVFGQRFASSGTPLGLEFPINSYTPTDQSTASIGVETDGDFVVSWKDNGLDGSGYGVFARRFKSSGVPQNLDTQGQHHDQWRPDLTRHRRRRRRRLRRDLDRLPRALHRHLRPALRHPLDDRRRR